MRPERSINGIFILTLFAILAMVSCQNKENAESPLLEPLTKSNYLLGTNITLTLYGPGSESVFDKIFDRIAQIEETMSLQRPDSVLSSIRNAAGDKAVQVPADVYKVIESAIDMAKRSGGAFDPAIGPLVAAWDITGNPRVPDLSEIESLLGLIDWKDIVLDEAASTVFLKKKGMAIDLGAIAKGYAADEAARIARESGIKSALLDLGGNLFVIGAKPGRDNWRIGIQNPDGQRGLSLGIVPAVDASAVTSGAYERFFEQDGKRYHHILSPFTGYPSESGLLQVSIVSGKESMYCDGLSTACFVLGLEKGMELVESMDGYEAIMVSTDHQVYLSSGLKENFTLTDTDYTLAK